MQAKKTMELQIWTTFHGKKKTHRVESRARKEETREAFLGRSRMKDRPTFIQTNIKTAMNQ